MKRCISVAVALSAASLISAGSAAGKSIQGSGSQGVANSLTVKLNAAQEELQAGNVGGFCDDLQAFINESKAQSGKKLSEEQANQNIAGATVFRQIFGC
jgi:hypothetical protein